MADRNYLIPGSADYRRAMELWGGNQHTSRQIADLFGISKNKLLGIAHRAPGDFPPKPSPIKRTSVKRAAPAINRAPIVRAPPPPRRPTAREIRIADYAALGSEKRTCQWPIGHPGDADFTFCTERRVTGKPYCATHCGTAFLRVKPGA